MTTEAINPKTKEGQEELRRRGIPPTPQPDDLTRPYWAGARRGELRMQRCCECGEYQHPPRPHCMLCGSDVAWEKLSGRGFVYSFIVVHHLLIPSFNEAYVVAQVKPIETSERAFLHTNIVGCENSDVYIGMPLDVIFRKMNDEISLPLFQPAADAKLRSRGESPPVWRGEPLPREAPRR